MSTLKVNAIRGTGASSDAISVNSTDGTCTAKITNNLSNRNLIINGAMNVAQRGATSNTAAAGNYTLDRWKLEHANLNEAPNITQHALTSSDTGPWAKGFRHSFHIENGNQSAADSNDYLIVYQGIEAQNMATSGWDYTSASSYITLSYWVRSSVSQNFYHYLRGRDGTEQLYAWETGTLSANTWTKITKTIPGHSNLQFDNDNGEGLRLTIPFYWGGNWTNNNSLNTWANYDTSNRTPDWASNWYTTNNATFEITGVQLEAGSVATDFEHRSYGDELLKCQRYYQQLPVSADHTMWGFGRAESNSARVQIPLTVPLRASPTITCSNNRSVKYDATMVTSTETPTVFQWTNYFPSIIIDFPSGGSLSHNSVYIVTSDGGSTGLQMSAEF